MLAPSNRFAWNKSSIALDSSNPLLKLVPTLPWHKFDESFSIHYTEATGTSSKLIHLIVKRLILKQMKSLNDEVIGSTI